VSRAEQVLGNNQEGGSSDFNDFDGFGRSFSFFSLVGSAHWKLLVYVLMLEGGCGVCQPLKSLEIFIGHQTS
jgi:hypothetical protein